MEQRQQSSAQPCSIDVENVWGPQVHGCGTNFDLTLFFQEAILSIGPLGIAICLAVGRIWQLVGQKAIINSPLLYGFKVVSASTYCLGCLFFDHYADSDGTFLGRLCPVNAFADSTTYNPSVSSDLSDPGNDCSLLPRHRRFRDISDRLPL